MDFRSFLYPFLLILVFLGVMLAVGVISSYFWLVALDKRGRTCPNCGRRGAGTHLKTEILDSTSYTKWGRTRGLPGSGAERPRLIEITEKEYEDYFECKYCGHQWTRAGKEVTQTPVSTESAAAEDADAS